jgi:uncharacterized protein YsxB (DUF464 family)
MTKIYFKKDGDNYISAEIVGHAGFNPGNDIVCSAISALGWTLLGALENVDGAEVEYSVKSGEITCKTFTVDESEKDKVNCIFETVLIGLKQIELAHPENLKIEILQFSVAK